MTNSKTQSHKKFLNENSATAIRGNNELMLRFVEIYTEHFFIKPNCNVCGFQNKYRKLKNKLNNKTMKVEKKEMLVKREFRNKMFRIKNEKGRIVRMYGKGIDKEFAKKLIDQSGDKALRMFKNPEQFTEEQAEEQAKEQAEEQVKEDDTSKLKKVENEPKEDKPKKQAKKQQPKQKKKSKK